MNIREVIARNTAYNAAGRIWDAVVSLVLVAYIVHRIVERLVFRADPKQEQALQVGLGQEAG